MLEALRDPFVQFSVLAVLALAAVIVSYLGINRPHKRLSFKVVLQQRLLSLREELKSRVQITFDGNPVYDVHMVIVHLINTGNVPIDESDYVQPLGVSFGEAEILDSEVLETKPENMSVSLEAQERRVILKPDVLNGGDAISIKVLLAGPADVTVEGRIKGLDRISEIGDRLLYMGLVMMFGTIALFTAVLTIEVTVFKVSETVFWFSVVICTLVMFLVLFLLVRKAHREIFLQLYALGFQHIR